MLFISFNRERQDLRNHIIVGRCFIMNLRLNLELILEDLVSLFCGTGFVM